MKTFQCTCKDQPILFFESSHCIACGKTVGIDDSFDQVEPYEIDLKTGLFYKAHEPKIHYKKCDNNEQFNACNGMVNLSTFVPDPENEEILCFGCRFNETVPDLSIAEHIPLWKKMETAKRRALYTLNVLPIPLNDDVARSQTKHAMGERYRTLLGHFRHELGHYYFDQLVANAPEKHALCKQYFGDDELDYQEALKLHYEKGSPKNWRDTFISEYATMHPYEDWAETWAHYMHIIDTLETAQNFSITGSTSGIEIDAEEVGDLNLPQDASYFLGQTSITNILDTWVEFSVILNSLNRSMGLADAYPFVLTQAVRTKLSFIHHAIHNKLHLLPVIQPKVEIKEQVKTKPIK